MNDDYISREAALKAIFDSANSFLEDEDPAKASTMIYLIATSNARDAVKAVPAADVRPVVRGEWLPYEFEIKPYKYGKPLWVKCSVCGKPSQIRNEPYASKYSCETIMTENILNFCRICGADMRKEDTP